MTAHGQVVLVPDLVLFLGQHKPLTELDAGTEWQLSTGGPVSNQAGVAGGAMRLKVWIRCRRVDETGRATEDALSPGSWPRAESVTGAAGVS